jgi:hypothetical protein
MHNTRVKVGLMIGIVAVFIAIIISIESDSPRISYHVSGLRLAQMSFPMPMSISSYFGEPGFNWLRSKVDSLRHLRYSRLSDEERRRAVDYHRQALLGLGYFQRREFTVNCALVGDADRRFMRMRSRLPLSCQLWQTQTTVLEGSTKVTVCARVADMSIWERLFHDFNNQLEKVK